MKCPLCTGEMNFIYKELKHPPIAGYDDVYACGKCKVVVTLKVEQNDDLYATVAPL